MLSELRTRLQAGKRAPAKQPVPNPGPERLETGMAWETPVVESLYETRSQLSATDAEWREKIYQQLLKVMDRVHPGIVDWKKVQKATQADGSEGFYIKIHIFRLWADSH